MSMAVGAWLVRWRRTVLACVLACAAVLAAGVSQLEVGFKVDGFFASDDPAMRLALQHYDDFGEQGYQPPDRLLLCAWSVDDPLAERTIEQLRAIEELARSHAIVARVITLASAQVPGSLRQGPERAANSRLWRQLLVSRQGDAVGGVIQLHRDWHHVDLQALCAALRQRVRSFGGELNFCGLPYHTMISRGLVREDMARFLPIGTLVSAVLLFWLVPHWLLACMALLVVPLTLVSTLGVMGYCGIGITMLTSTLPTLLLCMSVADGLHMVGRFVEERHRDGDPRRGAVRTFAALLLPCFLTSLTTIVGFASLLRAEMRDLGHLGLFAAVGMGFAFLYTMLLLPPLMSYVRSPTRERRADPAAWLVRGARRLQRAPAWLLGGVATVSVVVAAWLSVDLRTDHRITGDLWPDSELVRQIDYYQQRFVGIMPAEIVVELPDGLGDDVRRQLAEYARRIETEPGVARTLSIADLFADGVSPLLLSALRLTDALPPGMLEVGGEQTRMLVFRGDLGTEAWRQFATAVETHADGLDRIRPRLAGMQMVGTAHVLSMTDDLRNSFLGSVVVIFVLVWLACRRFRLAAIAMYACLVPMLLVVGVMVLSGLTLRPLTVISFCVALGLMIDDVIHLTTRWQEERADGRSSADAVQRTLATAGRPVVITTLVLLVGFVTILGSAFKGTFTFGLLVDLSLLGALLSALVLLPALLRLLGQHEDRGAASAQPRDPSSRLSP